MARITVEDCLAKLPNRFSLVLVSAERAKALLRGAQTLVDNVEGNKEIVLSLREIAAGKFTFENSDVGATDQWLPEEHRIERPSETSSDEDELPPEV